jgi:transcriptional regulator with XRE-family HTH domain
MRAKPLTQYLDENAWSQADLAREAGISAGAVGRAIKGETVTRRTANLIVAALDRAEQEKRTTVRAAHITLASVRGIHLTKVQRKKPRQKSQPEPATV